jgi:hypothetical protein
VTGDGYLVHGIEIGGADHFTLGGLFEHRLQLFRRQLDESRHGAGAFGNRALHVLAALADQAHGVGKAQAASSHKRGIFAQTMARHVGGLPAALIEDAECGN